MSELNDDNRVLAASYLRIKLDEGKEITREIINLVDGRRIEAKKGDRNENRK